MPCAGASSSADRADPRPQATPAEPMPTATRKLRRLMSVDFMTRSAVFMVARSSSHPPPGLSSGGSDPEISPADRPECRDRPIGEISGLGSVRHLISDSFSHRPLSHAQSQLLNNIRLLRSFSSVPRSVESSEIRGRNKERQAVLILAPSRLKAAHRTPRRSVGRGWVFRLQPVLAGGPGQNETSPIFKRALRP